MSLILTIIEHIDFISWWRGWEPTCRRKTGIEQDMTEKGNKKGNIWGQIADFRRPPPWGGRTEGVVRGRTHPPLQPAAEI